MEFTTKLLYVLVFWLQVHRGDTVNWGDIQCSTDTDQRMSEGLLPNEQFGRFPWIGVIQHGFYLGGKTHFAITAAILIHPGYAIAPAEDMAKIDRKFLQNNTHFIVWQSDSTKYALDVVDYVLNPEFVEEITFATVALVELVTAGQTTPGHTAPVLPVCLPLSGAGSFEDIYVVKMTDQTGEIKKEVYKMDFIENMDCNMFYNKSGLHYKKMIPTNQLCAVVQTPMKPCVWDGGAALVTRQSWGHWKLVPVLAPNSRFMRDEVTCEIKCQNCSALVVKAYVCAQIASKKEPFRVGELGFSVRGPGCAAPTRFVDVSTQLEWLGERISRTRPEDLGDDTVAVVLRSVSPHKLIMYSTDPHDPTEEGQCGRGRGSVMYKEETEVTVNKNFAQGFYFVSVANIADFACVTLRITAEARSNAGVWIEHHCSRDMGGSTRPYDLRRLECFLYFKTTAFIEFRFQFSFKALVELTLYGTDNLPTPKQQRPFAKADTTLEWYPTDPQTMRWGNFVPSAAYWYWM